MKIIDNEYGHIVEIDQNAYTYSTYDNDPRSNYRDMFALDWSKQENYIGEYIVFPYGTHNNLPTIIKEVVQKNYIAPGFLKRKTELMWGKGPRLCREDIDIISNRIVNIWARGETTIKKWLESFDYEKYLINCSVDYNHVQGCTTKFTQHRGYRVGKPFFKKLEHQQSDRFRLAYKRSDIKKQPTHIIETDWSLRNIHSVTEYKPYPILDPSQPFKHAISSYYSNMYTFCTDYYTIPDIYGSLEWLKQSTAVPLIFAALSRNGINVKYHIESPISYWEKVEDDLKKKATAQGKLYEPNILKKYQDAYLQNLTVVLSDIDNSGKFLHTVKELVFQGTNLIEQGWKITAIDQNIKDFVEAQIKISQRADRAVAAGINLHSALGNMSETGKVDSGSEQHYALLSYLNTGIDIQEMIVLKAINMALTANFPDSGLKLAFYHNVPEKQKDISPKDRTINAQEP